MIQLKKDTKTLFFIYLSFSTIFLLGITIDTRAQEDEEIFLFSGDLIKNFKFENFRGIEISPGGKVLNYLNFASDQIWRLNKTDVELVQTVKGTDSLFFRYFVRLTNDIFIYTSVPLSQATETFDTVPGSALAYTVNRGTGLFCAGKIITVGTMTGTFVEMGNVVEWNTDRHAYFGDLNMSFDIQEDPLPASIVDNLGNDYTKGFQHISIASATILENEVGKLSDDIPRFDVILPAEDSLTDRSGEGYQESTSLEPPTGQDEIEREFSINVNERITRTYIQNRFQDPVIPDVVGSSLNPTDKNGDPIFDPQAEQRSMQNGSINYNVGAISPLVYEWWAQLAWNQYSIITCDPVLLASWVDIVVQPRSTSFPVGVSVNNRWIRSKLAIVFDIWTEYEIVAKDDPQVVQNILNQPQEFYDDLAFTITIGGITDGIFRRTRTPGLLDQIFGNIFNFLLFVVIIIIVILVGFAVLRFYLSPERRARRREERKRRLQQREREKQAGE